MESNGGLKDLGQGAMAGAGIVAGFLPISVGFGALTLQTGISLGSTMGLSLWLFAGASQFALLEALMQGLSTGAALVTVVIINLRHLPMSLVAQRRYGHLPRWQQWLLCQGLVDETFALESGLKQQRGFGFFLGLHLACWGAWNLGTILGYQFGAFLPERWLRFALPGLFFCLLLGNLRGRLESRQGLGALGAPAIAAWRGPWVGLASGAVATVLLRPLGSGGLLGAIALTTLLVTLGSQPWAGPVKDGEEWE